MQYTQRCGDRRGLGSRLVHAHTRCFLSAFTRHHNIFNTVQWVPTTVTAIIMQFICSVRHTVVFNRRTDIDVLRVYCRHQVWFHGSLLQCTVAPRYITVVTGTYRWLHAAVDQETGTIGAIYSQWIRLELCEVDQATTSETKRIWWWTSLRYSVAFMSLYNHVAVSYNNSNFVSYSTVWECNEVCMHAGILWQELGKIIP